MIGCSALPLSGRLRTCTYCGERAAPANRDLCRVCERQARWEVAWHQSAAARCRELRCGYCGASAAWHRYNDAVHQKHVLSAAEARARIGGWIPDGGYDGFDR